MTEPLRRVLMTADAVGGVYSYALDLARELADAGIETVLAVMGPAASGVQREAARAIPGLTFLEAPYRLEWMNEPWSEVDTAGEWLLVLEREYRPQLVHLNGFAHGALPFMAPTLVVGHSCVLSWWQAVKGEPAPESYARYRERVHAGLMGADYVTAPSTAMLSELERYYGPLRAARAIYNGCDLALYGPGKKRAQMLAVGRVWDEAKNLCALVKTAASAPWPISVVGDPNPPEGAATACEGAAANLLGPMSQERVRALLAEAAVFVAPARYEPFGLAILEAAASGCALVLGDIPSLRELWQDAACFVSPGDDAALLAALQRLSEDHGLRALLSRRALERAQRYSRERFARSYLALYRQLVARERPAGQRRASTLSYPAPSRREVSACASSASITR